MAVDPRAGRVKAAVRGFGHPSAIVIAPGGRTAYVTDLARGTVIPVNLVTNRAITAPTLISPGASFPGADAAAITPDGKSVYVADARPGVAVIDTASSSRRTGPTDIPDPRGLAITPNGATAYLTSGTSGSVIPVDLATETDRPAIAGFGSPSAVAITDPPPPNDSVKLSARVKRTSGAVSDAVTCIAQPRSCKVTETLTAIGRLAAIGARAKLVMPIVGRRTVKIRAGRAVKVTITLDSSGRKLLGRFGLLPVVLSVAIQRGSHLDTVATREVTFRR